MLELFKTNKKSPWRNITIRQYYNIVKILKSEESQTDKYLEILSLLNGLSKDQLLDMKITELSNLNKDLSWLSTFPLNENSQPPKNIKIDENEYVIDTDFTHFTVAQYIDFQTYWAFNDLEKYYGNILACFVIPKDKQYGIDYNVQQLADLLYESIDILTANEIVFFSLKKSAKLMNDLMIYLNWEMKRMKKSNKDNQEIDQKLEELRSLYSDGLTLLKFIVQ